MMRPEPPVFASTYPYAACKAMGERVYKAWEAAQIVGTESLDRSPLQAFRTLGQLSRVCEMQLMIDASTYITRARNVMAGHFLRSDKDVWITLDDDMETDASVLRDLLAACRATRECVALPYFNRDGRTATHRRIYGATEWWLPHQLDGQPRVIVGNEFIDGGPALDRIPLRRVDRIGMGCVALHRDVVERLAGAVPWFRESNRSAVGEPDSPALFREDVQDGDWVGEDYYFAALCERAGTPIRVLLDATVTHQQWT
ncbi:MAG TPA: hypothetical protein DEP35_05990, partial [Deltaproteobacteria bacterium]|nr:hypothetical protein [Deltaproteobacteria bacterium]